jgi:hypothetical protein
MNLNFEKFKVQVCKICFQYKLKTQHENTYPKDTMESKMAWSMTGMSTLFGRDTGMSVLVPGEPGSCATCPGPRTPAASTDMLRDARSHDLCGLPCVARA